PEIVLSAAAGRDTMRLHALAGPVEGNSVLLQASTGLLPVRRAAYARLMADAQQRIRLIGRTHLALRASGGTTYGGRFSPQFFLSSLDNLRGFNFGDPRLLGDHYYVSNALLIVPVDWLIATPLLSGIYAVGGADFGAAFDDFRYAWTRRSLTAVTGANLALGGILLQLHFGKLVDIGGVPGADWVFNLNLKYLYM
ncbi:MAG: tolB protein precursor protein, partial [Myxococcales bacterium]